MTDDLVTWLDRLREVSEVASGGRPLSDALTLVADTARELLAFDFCGVLVPDAERHALVLAGWSGLSDEYVDGVNRRNPVALGGTAPSSRAFATGLPVTVVDIASEIGFAPWGGVAQEQGYRSMISVPLRGPDGVLGTLNGYHARTHRYSAAEVERLTLLANHAAAALSSAALLEELRVSNASLVEQRDRLTRSQATQERLLQVSLESGGPAGVVQALGELIGHPVRFEDARGETVAQSGTWAHGAGTAVPVHLADEPVARLVVDTADGEELDGNDALAVTHAVVVLALELLRARTAMEAEYGAHGDLLGDVLRFGVTDQSVRRAEALGHDLTRLRVAVVATVDGADADGRGRTAAEPDRALVPALSALSHIALSGPDGAITPLVAAHQGLLVALWPDTVTAASGPADAGAAAHAALRRAFPRARVLVASSDAGRASLAEAVRVARGAHAFARASGRLDGHVVPSSLGVVGVLLQVENPDALWSFVDAQLGPVIDYDGRRGSELIRTLRTHLDSSLDRAETGRRLRVHPNTVQQRLRRVESLLGVSLADPSAMLGLSAALAMLDMSPGIRMPVTDAAHDGG